MQIFNYQFKPKLLPTLATLIMIPLMINLGMWQSNKADLKQAKKDLFDQREKDAAISIGSTEIDLDTMRFRRVSVRGYFKPALQILLDNQVYKGQAGYHVITPLLISGSNKLILVNRGWVPVGEDRAVLPVIDTISSELEITGYLQDLTGKYFELSNTEQNNGSWQSVWQNLNVDRYKKLVKQELQPAIILLDSDSKAGGYVREWPKPDYRIEVNRGYAIQWYLMSFALFIIYIVTNLKKSSQELPYE